MLSMTGLSLKATLFVVGNPTVGNQLFEQDHDVGLYVPLRVFVYTDVSGLVSYDRPTALLGQFQNEKIGMVAQMVGPEAGYVGPLSFRCQGGRPSAPGSLLEIVMRRILRTELPLSRTECL